MEQNKVLQVHPLDNVLVALADLAKGSIISFGGEEYELKDNIPVKHKFVTRDLNEGDVVMMYGVMVGKATQPIAKGGLLNSNNIKHAAAPYARRYVAYSWQPPEVNAFKEKTFNGYHRSDGSVGTANYWLFVPTVFCENRNLDFIKEALNEELGYTTALKYKLYTRSLLAQRYGNLRPSSLSEEVITAPRIFPNVDGIKFLNHEGGCGGTRQDSEVLKRLLASYINHPNVAGATVLSLGCQHLQLDELKAEIFRQNPAFDKEVFYFEQQKAQSEEQLIFDAIKATIGGLENANKWERKPAPLSKLVLGVKCGGSDGFSGITANPAVGHCADMLVALGGTVLLAEFPELNGVEQELIDRCVDDATAEKFIRLMKSYSAQAQAVGSGFDMNPSPGNIRDGLITDAIKSAGAAKKGGTSPITDVLDYTEKATRSGLNLVCTPGNDVEATTGKTSSGANLILFTTGLGTPTGNPICPVIKVATNTALAERMPDIIDIDAGDILAGKSIEAKGAEILEYCIKVASGEVIPKAVALGQDDFIPWKRGVSL